MARHSPPSVSASHERNGGSVCPEGLRFAPLPAPSVRGSPSPGKKAVPPSLPVGGQRGAGSGGPPAGRGRRSREAAGPWAEDVRQPGAAAGLGTAPRAGRSVVEKGEEEGGVKGAVGRGVSRAGLGQDPRHGGGGNLPVAPGCAPDTGTAPPDQDRAWAALAPRQAPNAV